MQSSQRRPDSARSRDASFHDEQRDECDLVTSGPRKRLIIVASSGGHWVELSKLLGAFEKFDCHFVSTATNLVSPVMGAPIHFVRDCSRNTPFDMLRTSLTLLRLIRRINPDIVLSTGAAPGAVAIILAKLRGKRTVWIESLANCEKLSLSAHMVRRFTDIKLTQWEHLADQYPDFLYRGRIV